VLRTVPARIVSPAAVSHRRPASATRAQKARAQNSASAYTMDNTSEPGAIAQIATMSTLTRGSPVSFRPSLTRPHAAAIPATAVTIRPAAVRLTPGSQAIASMAAG
jgi:hypothetical protein